MEARGEGTGATRSQHVVLQGAADARTMAAALRPAIERSRSEGAPSEPLCLVVVPTVEQAFHAARQARLLLADPNIRVVPVSAVTRAQRLLQSAAVSVVTGTVQDLLQLRRQAALRLDSLRAVVLTGLDVMLAEGEQDHLVALLADAPSDATRIATLDQEVPETEAFLEAHLRRARRIVTVPTPEQPLAVVPRYAIATRAGRADALRALLDEVDPPSLAVVAFSDRGIVEAREALEEMGVIVDDRNVHVTSEAPPEHVALAVFWETPHTTELLDRVLSTRPAESVSLVQPNEVPAFQRLTGNATTAWNPPMRRETIASRTSQLRTAIRSTLANGAGASASELALLEPLLESYDALEIAAAAFVRRRKARNQRTQDTHCHDSGCTCRCACSGNSITRRATRTSARVPCRRKARQRARWRHRWRNRERRRCSGRSHRTGGAVRIAHACRVVRRRCDTCRRRTCVGVSARATGQRTTRHGRTAAR